MVRIAFLGPEGTFTEAALLQMVAAGSVPGRPGSGAVEQVPTDSAAASISMIRSGAVDYACVPIENSIDGSILPTLDSLATGTPLQVFAEVILDVEFAVVVAPGLTAADVRTVAAFPVAAAQVRHWLAAHLPAAQVVPAISNAASARDVADGLADAGISTKLAAQRYGLATLAEGVVDESNARTRFVLVGGPALPPGRTGTDRTSVILRITNSPGALVAALTEFSMRDIDLSRIESRPTRAALGEYVFFLDCIGHLDDHAIGEALAALHRRCVEVRNLGSWPIGSEA